MLANVQNNEAAVRESPAPGMYAVPVEEYMQRVTDLTALGVAALQGDENLQDQLTQSANQLTDILRWERRYAEAIALQERLIPYFPHDAATLRTVASTLKIESGDEQEGLKELRAMAEQDPNNAWGWITLGSSSLWAGKYAEAEKDLLRAVNLESAESGDRAASYQYLFKLYGIQKRVDEAVKAWEESIRLDPALETTIPDLLRMLIHWYHYDTAERFLPRERSDLRHKFYQSLINVKRSPMSTRNTWEWVMKYDPKAVNEGHEEFAEASLRFLKSKLAIEVIESFIDRGDFNRQRFVLAGLAWAQERMIERAKWALELALRVGDFERPRGTRRSVGGRRILDTEARILYGEIIVDTDIRQELDRYFMPVVDND